MPTPNVPAPVPDGMHVADESASRLAPVRRGAGAPALPGTEGRRFGVPPFELSTELCELFESRRSIHAVLFALAGFLSRSCGATRCLVERRAPDGPRLYTSDAGDAARHTEGRPLDPEIAELSALLQPDLAILLSAPRARRKAVACVFDGTLLYRFAADAPRFAALAQRLGAGSLMSVSLRSRSETLGRLYVVSSGRRFRLGELRALVRLAREAGPSIENLTLVERLATAAASKERRRISRDLHDGTIQPYIGLKLGLEALRRKLPPGNGAARDIDELLAMASDGIAQLRHYVGRLKHGAEQPRPCRLLPALRLHAEKFTQHCGVATQVVGPETLEICARLHDEILYMVREALSNVRRHTGARRATIAVGATHERLELTVANDRAAAGAQAFHPASIGERVRDLGGALRVERRAGGQTAVVIGLPL